jgi:RimJ/RimL family protein N-acetyltransferase
MAAAMKLDEVAKETSSPSYHPDFLIETDRLYISHFKSDNDAHCDFLVDLHKNQESPFKTREAARTQIQAVWQREHEDYGYGKYLISLKPVPAPRNLTTGFQETLQRCKPVGLVSLMRARGPISYSVPDVGFVVHSSETRQGYAKEAAKAILGMAKFHGIYEVLGFCDPDNAASQATLRSLGFENRGEMELKAFGGKKGLVWVQPGMSEDLSLYGF